TQTIAFYARLKATYLPVKAGNVDAVINFVLDYQ
ncbi:type 1 fimbrial protein, partial [Escherichia coli]